MSKVIEIYCSPTADARDSWLSTRRHNCSRVALLCLLVQSFNRRSDFFPPTSFIYGENQTQALPRLQLRVDPFGNLLAGPNHRKRRSPVATGPGTNCARQITNLTSSPVRPSRHFPLHVDERTQRTSHNNYRRECSCEISHLRISSTPKPFAPQSATTCLNRLGTPRPFRFLIPGRHRAKQSSVQRLNRALRTSV